VKVKTGTGWFALSLFETGTSKKTKLFELVRSFGRFGVWPKRDDLTFLEEDYYA
jgi:hypothetical protein